MKINKKFLWNILNGTRQFNITDDGMYSLIHPQLSHPLDHSFLHGTALR